MEFLFAVKTSQLLLLLLLLNHLCRWVNIFLTVTIYVIGDALISQTFDCFTVEAICINEGHVMVIFHTMLCSVLWLYLTL